MDLILQNEFPHMTYVDIGLMVVLLEMIYPLRHIKSTQKPAKPVRRSQSLETEKVYAAQLLAKYI